MVASMLMNWGCVWKRGGGGGWGYQTIHPHETQHSRFVSRFVVVLLLRIWFANSSAALLKTN